MESVKDFPVEGGCACGAVRYSMRTKPLFVHCCHCSWCQRETGAAFALNAMIETDRLEILKGAPAYVRTPSESGKGQEIVRCPKCEVALWSHYSGAGRKVAFVRVGTLDHPEAAPPDIHIFTSSKQDWLPLSANIPAFQEYYDWRALWPVESQARRAAMRNSPGS